MDEKEHLLNCIKDAKTHIKDLELKINYYNELIHGFEIGLASLEKVEKYEINFELPKHEAELLKEICTTYNQNKPQCDHPRVEIPLFYDHILCTECYEFISPKEVSEKTLIEHSEIDGDEWYTEAWSYVKFKNHYEEELSSEKCSHPNVLENNRVVWNGYEYYIDVCTYCGKPVKYHHTIDERLREYVNKRNKGIE